MKLEIGRNGNMLISIQTLKTGPKAFQTVILPNVSWAFEKQEKTMTFLKRIFHNFQIGNI